MKKCQEVAYALGEWIAVLFRILIPLCVQLQALLGEMGRSSLEWVQKGWLGWGEG